MGYGEDVARSAAWHIIVFLIVILAVIVIVIVWVHVELSQYDDDYNRIGEKKEREPEVQWEDMSDREKRNELLLAGRSNCEIDAILEYEIEYYSMFTSSELGC